MQNGKNTSPAAIGFPLSSAAVSILIFSLLASAICLAEVPVTLQETRVGFSDAVDGPDPKWTLSDSGSAERDLAIDLSSVMVRASRADEQVWHSLEIPGAAVHGQLGEPGLPVISRMVVVPRGMTLEVEVISATANLLTDLRILPVQDPSTEEFSLLSSSYRRSAKPFAGQPTIQVGRPAIMAGTTVVPVVLEVVAYDPVTREAQVWSDVRLELKTVADPNAPTPSRSAGRPLPLSFAKAMSDQVLGLDSADKSAAIAEGLGTYVAVHSGVAGVLEGIAPLLQWRSEQGYNVIVVNAASSGGSTAGIKSTLQSIYDDETIPPLEFITIFGDATGSYPIPAWQENLSGYGGRGDHYYAMLEGDDILADAHVARVSFGTTAQMNTVVNKIRNYEKYPPMGDTDWYGRACLQGDPSASGITTIFVNQWVKGQLMFNGWSHVDTTWSGNFANDMFSSVNPGVSAYGYRGYIGTSGISNNHVDALTNGGKLAVALLPTCESGSFANGTARSEAWLRAPNGGAVAAVGTATSGTHTRYNNCYYLGTWDGLLNSGDSRVGVAHTLGKVALFNGYFLAEPDRAEIWAVWNNVMGDGATAMWTAVPKMLDVSHPRDIGQGAQAVTFQVQSEGLPVAGARVSLFREAGIQLEDIQISGLTDENGQVILDLPTQDVGSVAVTVTGTNLFPYSSGMTVGPVDVFCGVSSHVADGPWLPGSTLNITPRLTNHGTSDAFAVEAEVSVLSGPATLSGSSLVFGNIASGTEVEALSALAVTLNDDAMDRTTVQLLVTATDGVQVWTSILDGTVTAADFHVADIDLGSFGGSLDPGDSGSLSLILANEGSLDASGVLATLTTDSPWVNITDDISNFGNIVSGGSGLNLISPFQLTVSPVCYGGHLANFAMDITYNGVQLAMVPFAMTVGTASTDQPTGPDLYGYYAIDNTDLVSELVPVYDWVAIDPNNGAQGTDLGLTDFGWEQDDTKTIDLPFNFQFYGDEYNRISICSNGWLAMGETPVNFYRNFPLPASHSAGALIAPFWDNLKQAGGNRVYTWYDDVEHRFIIQWYGMRNDYSNLPQNFEVILMDPAHHPTDTGDGMIVFQYETVNNTDNRDGYATVGIQNMPRTDGLNYTYWNQYAAGAATLASGRAILFVPVGAPSTATCDVTPGDITLTLGPDQNAIEFVHIENNGEGDSELHYSVQKIDPIPPSAPPAGDKNLTGSSLWADVSQYLPGETVDVIITAQCASNDGEQIIGIEMDLPPGLILNSASNMFGSGLPPLLYTGGTGDGAIASWGSSGYISNGMQATAAVNLTFGSVSGSLMIPYTLTGDQSGSQPHEITGTIVINPSGPTILVFSPNGGEQWTEGETREITFAAHNGPVNVLIELDRGDGNGWQTLAEDVPVVTGSYTWDVVGPASAHCRVRVSDSADGSVQDISNAEFTIGHNLDWITIGQYSGAVPGGDSETIQLDFDSTGLANGTYRVDLVVTNSVRGPVIVPVTLEVGGTSAVETLPQHLALEKNYPNPFNPRTNISFVLPADGSARLQVYDMQGRLVKTLHDGALSAGYHTVMWDGTDDTGQRVASGVFLYRLVSGDQIFSRKMLLMK